MPPHKGRADKEMPYKEVSILDRVQENKSLKEERVKDWPGFKEGAEQRLTNKNGRLGKYALLALASPWPSHRRCAEKTRCIEISQLIKLWAANNNFAVYKKN